MKIVSAMLLTALFFVAGCASSRILGPIPSRPSNTISVKIDSIPSGADVYAIETDGQLGAKLGTTPFLHNCGLASQNWLRRDTKEVLSYKTPYEWGGGTVWKYVGQNRQALLFLNIALAKGDHSLAVASKEIWRYGETIRDKNIALTVPLKTIAQVNREMEMHLRRQALNQPQNINIQYKKDGLDSINSGLDALIKLNGLRAFR